MTPADYGLVGMTAVLVGMLNLFSDGGLLSAVVQRDSISHKQVSNLFWINVAIGSILCVVLLLCAPLIAKFYGEPKLVAITAVMSVGLIVTGLTIQHKALLLRQMRYSYIASIDFLAALLAVTCAIILALNGAGYWSLVCLSLMTLVCRSIGYWIAMPWRPGNITKGNDTKSLVQFGSNVFIYDIFNFLSNSADRLLIGKFFGAAQLGSYDKAYSLLMLPISQINSPLASVAKPALSRTKTDPKRYGRFLFTALELVISGTMPIIVSVAVFADRFVLFLWGENWVDSANMFRLLACAAALRAATNPVSWVFISMGKTQQFRNMGMISATVIILSFFAGIPFGVEGIAIAYSISMLLLFFPMWIYTLRQTDFSIKDVISCAIAPTASCIAAALIALYICSSSIFESTTKGILWFENMIAFGVFFAVYGLMLLFMFKRLAFYKKVLVELRSKR